MMRNKIMKNVAILTLLILVLSMFTGCSLFGKTSKENDEDKQLANSTSNETTSKKMVPKEEWVNAYVDYINNNFKDDRDGSYYGSYALVYVDDDDIPEIMYLGGEPLGGAVGFLVYADGKVNDEIFMRGEEQYLPGEGLIYGTNGLRWEDWHTVYEIKDGHFKVVANGGSELNETTKLFDNYSLNDVPATQEEVGKTVAQAFGNGNYRIKDGRIIISNDRAKSGENEPYYSHDEIVNMLNGMK